ncbi:hypothetical protein AN639_12815, partial [Candidatus Epulonipiscium fishelsonii]
SNITANYIYFYNRLGEVELENLLQAIQKLFVIEIKLEGEDDPQLIFESLNSTGLDLDEADRIRNFILTGKSPEIQEEWYFKYWYKIEKNTENEISEFIRDYLSCKQKSIPNKNRVYLTFKNFIKDKDIMNTLEDLLKFSKFYKEILSANYQQPNDKLNVALSHINKLEIGVSYPFLLELFDNLSNKVLTLEQMINCLDLIQNFVIRRQICDLPTSKLNKVFITLDKLVKSDTNFINNYDSVLGHILSQKEDDFPNNEVVQRALLTKNIYNMKPKNRTYLFYMLENFENKERVDIFNSIENRELTVEHIMPQKLSSKWIYDLGENYDEVHKKYLHTLGNLTLTGYNSKMSNKTFHEKKSMDKGFNESRLYLNKELSKIENWNEQEIKKRTKLLTDRFLNIWKYPKKLKINTIQEKMYLLDEDIDFTGTLIKKFDLLDETVEVSNWADFTSKIYHILYEKEPITMIKLAHSKGFKSFIRPTPEGFNKSTRISNNVYLNNTSSVITKLRVLKKIISYYDIEPAQIALYVESKK